MRAVVVDVISESMRRNDRCDHIIQQFLFAAFRAPCGMNGAWTFRLEIAFVYTRDRSAASTNPLGQASLRCSPSVGSRYLFISSRLDVLGTLY